MNIHTAIASLETRAKSFPRVYAETVRSLIALAPSKPFDAETAHSMASMNDIGGLVTGDTDTLSDVPWLTSDVIRALWNTCARLSRGAK